MGADKSAENNPNAPKIFGPICLPKHKSLRFSKKNLSLGVFIVCGWDPSKNREDSNLVFLLISNLINKLRLLQFLGTNTTETNKSLKTDANGAY